MAEGYSIFSQMQGPVTSVSLYGDAATQGIAAGKAVPTPLTAAIEGGLKGLQQGLAIQSQFQENTIRQNTIDRLPETNAIQDIQLKNNESIAQLNKTKAAISVATEAQQLEQAQTSLDNDVSKQKAELTNRNTVAAFKKRFDSSDPVAQADMVLGGNNTSFFADNPKAYATYVDSVINNPDNGVAAETKESLRRQRGRGIVSSQYDKKQELAAIELQKLEPVFQNSPLTKRLTRASQYSYNEMPQSVEIVKPGTYKLKNGYRENNAVGQPLPGAGNIDKDSSWQVFDSKSGKLLDSFATNDDKALYDSIIGIRSLALGTMKTRALESYDRKPTSSQGQQPTPTTAQTTPSGDYWTTVSKKILEVPEATYAKVAPSMDILRSKIAAYSIDPKFRGTPAGMKAIDDTAKIIARTISDSEFDSSPALQTQYTSSHVKDYNDSIAHTYSDTVLSFRNPFRIEENREKATALSHAWTVSSPQELYYVNQQSALNVKLQSVIKAISNEQQSRRNQAAKIVANKQHADGFLGAASK